MDAGRKDLETLTGLLGEDLEEPGTDLFRWAAALATLALFGGCLGGVVALHNSLQARAGRTNPAWSARHGPGAGSGNSVQSTPFPALVSLPLQPILDDHTPRTLPTLPPRAPEPDATPILLGERARSVGRHLAVMNRSLRKLHVPGLAIDRELIEARASVGLPGWVNLRYALRRLRRAFSEAELDPETLSMNRGPRGEGTLELRLAEGEETWYRLRLEKPEAPGGRLALVVDDVGYGGRSTGALLSYRFPLNIAILPFYAGSRRAARRAQAEDQDPMLHMPFQPLAAEGKYRKHVVVGRYLEPREIRARTLRALDEVPGVRGMNNHMGSLGTESWYVCAEVLRICKEKGLFFVDSLTSPKSVVRRAARKLGVPTAARNTGFLDNEPTLEGVTAAYRKLLARCRKGRDLVAILHDKPESVAVTGEAAAWLREQGVELVFVSELTR